MSCYVLPGASQLVGHARPTMGHIPNDLHLYAYVYWPTTVCKCQVKGCVDHIRCALYIDASQAERRDSLHTNALLQVHVGAPAVAATACWQAATCRSYWA